MPARLLQNHQHRALRVFRRDTPPLRSSSPLEPPAAKRPETRAARHGCARQRMRANPVRRKTRAARVEDTPELGPSPQNGRGDDGGDELSW